MLVIDKLKLKENFSANECDIADYLLKNNKDIKSLSARFIATKTYTSASSVVRLCKKLGYEGFNDFKEDFIKEVEYKESNFKEIDPNYPFCHDDTDMMIANKIGLLYKETIDDTLCLLDTNTLKKAVDILNKSKIIYICSSGVHGQLASSFQEKMSKIGKTVIIYSRLDHIFYEACYTEQSSCFILISYSGETETVLRVARKLKERKILSIAITSIGGNTLSSLSDYSLFMSTREKLINNIGNFSINISTVLLLDILYSNYFNLNHKDNMNNRITFSKEFEKKRYSENSILHNE